MALTKTITQIKVGKTYYHKIANYPVTIKIANKREVAIVPAGDRSLRTWEILDIADFLKTYHV